MPRPPGPGLRAELREPGNSAQAVAETARHPRQAAAANPGEPKSQGSAATAPSAAARALYNLTTGRAVTLGRGGRLRPGPYHVLAGGESPEARLCAKRRTTPKLDQCGTECSKYEEGS